MDFIDDDPQGTEDYYATLYLFEEGIDELWNRNSATEPTTDSQGEGILQSMARELVHWGAV